MNNRTLKSSILTFLLFFSSLNVVYSAKLCNSNDENTLLKIKYHFHNASVFTNWDPNTDCCTNWTEIQCDAHGRVTMLEVSIGDDVIGEFPTAIGDLPYLQFLTFSSFSLSPGPIPPSIAKLNNLQHLDFNSINLNGSIPDFLSQLTNLEYLDLGSNNLIGQIPSSLGKLRKLKLVSLSSNHLSGHIPTFFGYMKNLRELYLYDNKLTGPIPSSLSELPNLFGINLGLNQLTGSIPDSFGSFKTPVIDSFFMYNNNLSGPIPKSFGKANITDLRIDNNKFTGDASFLFSRDKTELITIDIDNNLFSFNFSNVDLPQKLANIDISHNNIYGSLPKRLGQLPLQRIDVSFNQLCGQIPTGRRLKQFKPAVFANNKCLCGAPLAPCN